MENNDLFGYKKLFVWHAADKMAKKVYEATINFPKHELYGITSQLRRAALSVPLNIVEGHSRNNKNEFRQFLRIALGSLSETEYLLIFSKDQKYLTEKDYENLEALRDQTGALLWKLFKSQC